MEQLSLQGKNNLVHIPGPAGILEALVDIPINFKEPAEFGIICHPHPLYQGSMHNKVVTTAAKAFYNKGLTTIRFNFRGVGNSSGEYNQAEGEIADALAVLQWAKKILSANMRFYLAGFSFGSYIAAKLALQHVPECLLLIAPPVINFNFSTIKSFYGRTVIVAAEKDEVVELQAINNWQKSLEPLPYFYSIPDTSHFFHGKLIQLREQIESLCFPLNYNIK